VASNNCQVIVIGGWCCGHMCTALAPPAAAAAAADLYRHQEVLVGILDPVVRYQHGRVEKLDTSSKSMPGRVCVAS
jgi:hypothetical protein